MAVLAALGKGFLDEFGYALNVGEIDRAEMFTSCVQGLQFLVMSHGCGHHLAPSSEWYNANRLKLQS